uniref:DUF3778 domain-containing protein n=1 Tax=Oryza nivara TaxID=4536 RepID=A0A0E0J8N7_ORYNI
MLQVALFLAISVLIARQKSIGSLSKAPLLIVGWSTLWPSHLFPCSRNRAWFVIRVELGPPAQFRLSGLLLEFLIFNDESRGDASLSPVMLTPKSTAQQPTSILCRSRGAVAVLRCRGSLVVTAASRLPVGLLLFLLFGYI